MRIVLIIFLLAFGIESTVAQTSAPAGKCVPAGGKCTDLDNGSQCCSGVCKLKGHYLWSTGVNLCTYLGNRCACQ
jgi:hypothetical protein